MYNRVIPRDLFNEAKLLKCLGRLILLIHEGKAPWLLTLVDENECREGFGVEMDQENNELVCKNIRFEVIGSEVYFSTPYNSKREWPLIFRETLRDETGDVFDEHGAISNEFHYAMSMMVGS